MQGGASRTALGAALHRAAHQLFDRPPLFEDPLALRIVGREGEARLRNGQDRHGTWRTRGLRLFIVVRSRFSEDTLAEAYRAGVRQYVLLGAGLDTLAYRAGDRFPDLRIYEVDHPATQAWKRQRLGDAGITPPAALTFVPIDFEHQALAAALSGGGFDADAPAVFAWLGVVPYLSRDAILKTLQAVAALTKGTQLVFDYAEPARSRDIFQRLALAAFAARVAAIGEPLKSFFVPETLIRDILATGFSGAEDFAAAALNARYLDGRADGLMLRGSGHLMRAAV